MHRRRRYGLLLVCRGLRFVRSFGLFRCFNFGLDFMENSQGAIMIELALPSLFRKSPNAAF
jgi:hypothetical protein